MSLWNLLAPTVGTRLLLTAPGQVHAGVVRRVRVEPGGTGEVEFTDGHVMRLDPFPSTR